MKYGVSFLLTLFSVNFCVYFDNCGLYITDNKAPCCFATFDITLIITLAKGQERARTEYVYQACLSLSKNA